MVLYLVGLGLWDEKDISLRGLEAVKSSHKAYLEEYTSVLAGSGKEKLEKLAGREIVLLEREDLEQDTEWMDEAKEKSVALMVGGDPLSATTHSDLAMRAREKGIEVKVIHNASIFTAVAETGLQLYKFGKTATVAYWEKNYRPTSFYAAVRENKARGLHTLLLLDIKPGRRMTPKEAIGILTEIDPDFKGEEVVVMSRAGGDTGISWGKASEIAEMVHGGGLHVLIVPGKLHVMEKAFLSQFRKH